MRLFNDPDPVIENALAELRKTPFWPYDEESDLAYMRDMRDQFPGIDLAEEVRAWRTWMLDHDSRKKVKPRARFRNWLVKAREFRSGSRGPDGSGGDRPRKTGLGARPATVEQFGASSSTSLERW